MPKRVDHQQRRAQIAEAVCSLVSARGLEAVSLRDVAAEAGISMGRVQHYFRTKDEMLLFVLEYVADRDVRGTRECLAAEPAPPSPRAVVGSVLGGLLDDDPRRVEAQRVGLAFLARALVEPRLAASLLQGYAGIQGLLEQVLRQGIDEGSVDAATDPESAATEVFALAEGLRAQTLLGHLTRARALAVLDDRLDRLFTG
ncbi:TetR/AcrR family transcriptional regulator [Nocardiopsis sp. Huas11]|uniref:TetR/AcrR family transcriptional regulator n=1 Tax=Nocardiopsis sp. Huas11 TaxID=2183912 RepID=UPI001315603F|nr:TetR/AcrR family transcriptional regulator [Nocardiopsis sp. Huas11]